MTPLHILCFHCEAECGPGDYCFGCHEVICQGCIGFDVFGPHRPGEHKGLDELDLRRLRGAIAIIESLCKWGRS